MRKFCLALVGLLIVASVASAQCHSTGFGRGFGGFRGGYGACNTGIGFGYGGCNAGFGYQQPFVVGLPVGYGAGYGYGQNYAQPLPQVQYAAPPLVTYSAPIVFAAPQCYSSCNTGFGFGGYGGGFGLGYGSCGTGFGFGAGHGHRNVVTVRRR